jgi:stalled ribosome alternative rescue factor ArfA
MRGWTKKVRKIIILPLFKRGGIIYPEKGKGSKYSRKIKHRGLDDLQYKDESDG